LEVLDWAATAPPGPLMVSLCLLDLKAGLRLPTAGRIFLCQSEKGHPQAKMGLEICCSKRRSPPTSVHSSASFSPDLASERSFARPIAEAAAPATQACPVASTRVMLRSLSVAGLSHRTSGIRLETRSGAHACSTAPHNCFQRFCWAPCSQALPAPGVRLRPERWIPVLHRWCSGLPSREIDA
jgi:hypothetical protein